MLEKVLYVRVGADLIRCLDVRLKKERAAQKGRKMSRADLVRMLLWEALDGGNG